MNGKPVALDTTDAVAVLNEAGGAEAWLLDYDSVFLPVPVVGELRFGAMNSSRVAENLERIERLVARCRILDVNAQTTRHYAELRIDLKRKGTPIPENDLWIAAICRQHDLSLASSDEHFSLVPGLIVIRRP